MFGTFKSELPDKTQIHLFLYLKKLGFFFFLVTFSEPNCTVDGK